MLPGNHCIWQDYFITWSSIYNHSCYLIYIFGTKQPLSQITRRILLLWDALTLMHNISWNTDKKTEENSRLTLEGTADRFSTVSDPCSKKAAASNEFSTSKTVTKAQINSMEQSPFWAADNHSAIQEIPSIL
jgi:hypothetical protein